MYNTVDEGDSKRIFMNKYLILLITFFTLTAQKAFCLAEFVSPEVEGSLKTHSGEPGIMSIVFSLAFVIFLIYITGIIYSKLNMVGAKTVKDQLRNSNINRAIVLSTTQLGQHKNLHVIEINDKCYLIGATPNSINLIKELGTYKEKPQEKSEKPNEEEIDQAIKVLYGSNKEGIAEEVEPEPEDEFNIHKKYL